MNKVIRLDFLVQPSTSFTSILWTGPPTPLTVGDVKQKLKSLRVVNNLSHCRFMEEIEGQHVWLDIVNDHVPCPGENALHVKVKILKQIDVRSNAFFRDLFKGIDISEIEYENVLVNLRKNILSGMSLKEEEEIKETPNKQESKKANPKSNNNQTGFGFEDNSSSGYQKFTEKNNTATSLNINDHIEFEYDEEVRNEFNDEKENPVEHNPETFVDIDFDDNMQNFQNSKKKKSEEIDFLNGSGFPANDNTPMTANESLGELDDLMGPSFSKSNSNPKSQNFNQRQNNNSSSTNQGGILDLDFGNNNSSSQNNGTTNQSAKKQTAHEEQIDDRNNKLVFANEIDPIVKNWSKNQNNGTPKDIRSLLLTLKVLFKDFNVAFENIMLSEIMSESAVKKKYYRVIKKIHPDKTNEKDPRILYLFERVTEVINEAFKKHRNM